LLRASRLRWLPAPGHPARSGGRIQSGVRPIAKLVPPAVRLDRRLDPGLGTLTRTKVQPSAGTSGWPAPPPGTGSAIGRAPPGVCRSFS